MLGKPGFQKLVFTAKTGDKDALLSIVYNLNPALKKYSRRMGYIGAYNDLVLWLLDAIDNYKA
ncbi:MAG: helix-turn-helix domain-containing protein [Desulfitobacteriaceae bacterium]|nr:helix-turn-helix domain-containing protein [Desulfitobacteriaceae bacterium]